MDTEFVPCASCEQHSYVFVYWDGHELSYCAHHATERMDKLEALPGAVIIDNRKDVPT